MARRVRSLSANWTWAPSLLSEAQVRALAEGWFGALEALVRHAGRAGSGGRSPSDLTLVALSQAAIERLERAYPEHRGRAAADAAAGGSAVPCALRCGAPDVYTVQLDLELDGRARCGGARGCGAGRGGAPRKACGRASGMTGLEPAGCGDRAAGRGAVAADRSVDAGGGGARRRGLRRCCSRIGSSALIWRGAAAAVCADPAWSAERHRLVLSSHHVLMDGWSAPVLVRELLALYGRPARPALPR